MSSATIIGAAIFGQLIASMVIDHFGWFNVPVLPINTSRIIGSVLLLFGAILHAADLTALFLMQWSIAAT